MKSRKLFMIACLLLFIGITCIVTKSFSKEYIDSAGILQEMCEKPTPLGVGWITQKCKAMCI